MRKRSNERTVWMEEGGRENRGMEGREKARPIRNLSHGIGIRLLYIYSAYRERRQVLLTPLNAYPRIYALFLRVILLRCSTWSRTTGTIPRNRLLVRCHTLCIYIYLSPSLLLSPTPLPLPLPLSPPLFLAPHSSRLPFISLSYSLSFPYFSANQRWIRFPLFRAFLSHELWICFWWYCSWTACNAVPDKNLGPFLGNNASVIGDRSRCRGW